jgi:hypothetical protein
MSRRRWTASRCACGPAVPRRWTIEFPGCLRWAAAAMLETQRERGSGRLELMPSAPGINCRWGWKVGNGPSTPRPARRRMHGDVLATQREITALGGRSRALELARLLALVLVCRLSTDEAKMLTQSPAIMGKRIPTGEYRLAIALSGKSLKCK